MSKSSRTNEVIYEFVCTNPGMCTYDIEKKLNMSGGRVRHALSRLQQMGFITFKWVKHNPHFHKLSFPNPAAKLLPKIFWKELKNLKV